MRPRCSRNGDMCMLKRRLSRSDLWRSGKTAAFGLPVIQAVGETLSKVAPEKLKTTAAAQPQATARSARAVVCMSSEDKDALFVVEGARCRGTSDAKFVGGRSTVGVKGKLINASYATR